MGVRRPPVLDAPVSRIFPAAQSELLSSSSVCSDVESYSPAISGATGSRRPLQGPPDPWNTLCPHHVNWTTATLKP